MHPTEIHFLSKTSQDSHIERVIDATQVLPDHLLGQALAGNQETRHGSWWIFQKPALDQVDDPLVGFFIEYIQTRPVVSFAYDLVDRVHVGHDIVAHNR